MVLNIDMLSTSIATMFSIEVLTVQVDNPNVIVCPSSKRVHVKADRREEDVANLVVGNFLSSKRDSMWDAASRYVFSTSE